MSSYVDREWFYHIKGRNIHLYQLLGGSSNERITQSGVIKSQGIEFIYPNENIEDGLRIEYTALSEPFISEALETTTATNSGITIAFVDANGGSDTMTDSASGFGDFANGDRIRVQGSASNDGDYTLSENSPCINAGTDYYIIDGDTLINLPSNDYFGQAPDLGAYESEYDIGLLPEIEMSIDSIYVTLEPNSIETMNLIIENIGEGPLSFETDLIYSKINYALEFNTGDYIDIEDEELFDISNFTFEVWINVDETNGWRTIIDIDNDEQVLGIHNGQYAIYGRCGNNSLGSVQSDWNHLAWTVSGENYFVFLNGIEIGSGLGCSSFVDADHLMIGSGYGGNEYFSGSIDDVRIWNRALTQEEILLNMNQTLYQEDGDGLIGYWVFDEGSGNTTLDYSGNGNNGTIVGAEWVESSMINFPWLTIEPSNGIIIPGDNIIVSIIFDTQNLVPDIYFADLILNTNDIDELQIIIPITLDIIEEFIYGCTNPESINYNPNAIIDDGSCEYCILGDVNGDDSINILDIVIMVDAILGNGTEYNDCMDVNVDGTVNILDIVILVDIILNP